MIHEMAIWLECDFWEFISCISYVMNVMLVDENDWMNVTKWLSECDVYMYKKCYDSMLNL